MEGEGWEGGVGHWRSWSSHRWMAGIHGPRSVDGLTDAPTLKSTGTAALTPLNVSAVDGAHSIAYCQMSADGYALEAGDLSPAGTGEFGPAPRVSQTQDKRGKPGTPRATSLPSLR